MFSKLTTMIVSTLTIVLLAVILAVGPDLSSNSQENQNDITLACFENQATTDTCNNGGGGGSGGNGGGDTASVGNQDDCVCDDYNYV